MPEPIDQDWKSYLHPVDQQVERPWDSRNDEYHRLMYLHVKFDRKDLTKKCIPKFDTVFDRWTGTHTADAETVNV